MGTTENKRIIAVPLGSYSADAKVGKATGLSPDSMNMRFDVFGNMYSVLGNTAYYSGQVGGSYNLGGDVFQYIRANGSFDVVLSRKKAEGKIYKVTGAVKTETNLLDETSDWTNGIPAGGDNLFTVTSDKIIQKPQALPQLSVIPNFDFESGIADWTFSGSSAISTTEAYHGVKSGYMIVNPSGDQFYFKVWDLTNDEIVGTTATYGYTSSWTKITRTEASLQPAIGHDIYIEFGTPLGNIRSSYIAYYGGELSAYYKMPSGGDTAYVDYILSYLISNNETPAIDFGVVTPTNVGSLTCNVTIPESGSQIEFFATTSADDITYGPYTSMGVYNTVGTGVFTADIGTYIPVLKRYYKYDFTISKASAGSDLQPSLSALTLGGQWVSAVQNLGGIPAAWGVFTLTSVNTGAATLTVEIDTSVDGNTWDGYTAITTGNTFTGTLRQFIRYRVTMNKISTAQYVELDSLSLNYTTTSGTGANTQLTGFGGTGWNQYFAVLNNLLVISDSTTTPHYWTGTGTAFVNISGGPSGGTYPEVHYDRYFLAYSPTYPSRIWWSASKDPTTWNLSTQFIDINPDDGDFITGIKSYGGVLYVFKHQHAYLIQGNDFNPTTGNYSVQSMPQLVGTESHKSLIVGSDGNLYWYSVKGVIQFNGSSTPNYIGRGFVDDTIQRNGFKQNLNSYNIINTADFILYNELWFAFGHTIYSYNYITAKWNRILFDNQLTGFSVYALAQYSDTTQNNILSFTGNNVVEQWNDTATFYLGSQPSPYTTAIQSYYRTDFMDGEWYLTKNTYKLLMNVLPLTATAITITNYLDYSTTAQGTNTVTPPTTIVPDQYRRIDLVSSVGKRMQLKMSCTSLQFGVSDISIQEDLADGGRL